MQSHIYVVCVTSAEMGWEVIFLENVGHIVPTQNYGDTSSQRCPTPISAK